MRALIQHQRFSYRQEAMDMLNVQTIYSKIYSMIAEYEFFNDSVNYNRLVYFIKSNNEYVTKELINKLKDIGIVFSDSFKNMVDNLDEFSSLKEKKLFEKRKIQSALEIYLRDYKRRPERGSELDLIYRKKIAGLLKNELRDYLKIFVRCGIPYTTEEKIILDLANPSEVKLYLDHLNVKIASEKYKVDNLEKRVLNKLKKRKMLNEYPRLLDLLPNYHNEITVEDKIVDELNQKIRRHPEENIDFEAYSLSVSPNKLWKLEARRMNMLINNYLIKILDKLKNKKISLRYLLSDEERELFESYREFNDLDKANVELFRNIKELEEEMRCEEENVYRDEILQNYLDFIHNHNGERPNCASDNEEEKSLANHFEIIRELLSRSEEAKITAAIKESEMGSYSSFYESYVNFILENERMPCGNSDDAYEVKLNNLYIDLNRKFSHEQNNEIRKLRKTFSRATMQATIEFNKKKG